MMNFNEFYEILEGSTRGFGSRLAPFIVHFKPEVEDENHNPIAAGNPAINNDVFSVYTGFLRHGSFKITYPYRATDPEKVTFEELQDIFDERGWENFIVYNPEIEARRMIGS